MLEARTLPKRAVFHDHDSASPTHTPAFAAPAGGVFAPHSRLRATVTPAHRGMGAPQPLPAADPAKPPIPRHVAMSWARRLKRVFGIEIEGCARCGGKLKILASIEEPEVIAKILAHLKKTAPERLQPELPLGARAPPSQAGLL